MLLNDPSPQKKKNKINPTKILQISWNLLDLNFSLCMIIPQSFSYLGWFLLWLLPSIHQLLEGYSGTHYPSDTHTDKNLGCPVNAVPTQCHSSYWSVSPEITFSAKLGSHLMSGAWNCLAETPVHLSLSLCHITLHIHHLSSHIFIFEPIWANDTMFRDCYPCCALCWIYNRNHNKS